MPPRSPTAPEPHTLAECGQVPAAPRHRTGKCPAPSQLTPHRPSRRHRGKLRDTETTDHRDQSHRQVCARLPPGASPRLGSLQRPRAADCTPSTRRHSSGGIASFHTGPRPARRPPRLGPPPPARLSPRRHQRPIARSGAAAPLRAGKPTGPGVSKSEDCTARARKRQLFRSGARPGRRLRAPARVTGARAGGIVWEERAGRPTFR